MGSGQLGALKQRWCVQREFLKLGAEARGEKGAAMGVGVAALRVRRDLSCGLEAGGPARAVPPGPAGGDSGAGRGGRLGGALNCLNGL